MGKARTRVLWSLEQGPPRGFTLPGAVRIYRAVVQPVNCVPCPPLLTGPGISFVERQAALVQAEVRRREAQQLAASCTHVRQGCGRGRPDPALDSEAIVEGVGTAQV